MPDTENRFKYGTTPQYNAVRYQVSRTSDLTLTATDHNGILFNNEGASGTVVLTLPAATVGLNYRAVRTASHALRLDPNGSEVIRGGGAGKYLELDTDGDSVELECCVAGEWEIVGGYGTYAYEP